MLYYIAVEDDDYFDVRDAVEKVIPKWKGLGSALGVRAHQLRTIEANHRQSDDCISEMLQTWLRRSHNEERFGPPTWKKLAQVVGAKAGGNNMALALEIAKDHQGIERRELSCRERVYDNCYYSRVFSVLNI